MEGKETAIPRRIPRLSRLPVPRAPSAGATDIHHDDSHKVSQLPRPSTANSLRSRSRTPLSEATHQPPSLRFGRVGQQSRNLSPVEHRAPIDQSDSLKSTPQKSDTFDELHADENAVPDFSHVEGQKRKPRPSLSERTLETLSQISPSASPSRPRPGTATGHFSMRPPNTPASVLRSSRSNASLKDRNSSPSKQAGYQSGRPRSRLKGTTPLRTVRDSAVVYSPAQPFATGAKTAVANGKRVNNQGTASMDENEQVHGSSSSLTPSTRQARSTYGTRNTNSRDTSAVKSSLHSTSQTPSKPVQTDNKSVSNRHHDTKQSKLGKSRRGSAIATVSSSASRPHAPVKDVALDAHNAKETTQEKTKGAKPRSSLTLRETIAKAKAAKREADLKRQTTSSDSVDGVLVPPTDDGVETLTVSDYSEKTQKKRIESAVTSGVLNLAAMGLKFLPDSIRTMYDSGTGSHTNWSEAVDLIKLNAADNEIEELSETFFPDWSVQELQEDEDKTNQFRGLQVLDLRGNQLASLTIGLRRLEQLNTLVLNSNRLENHALDVICQILNLKELRLANNNFSGALPSALGNLTELQVLDLHSNNLSMLPDNIAALHKLRRLDLSDNSFDVVSSTSLQGLPLVELYFSKNSLSGTFFQNGFYSEQLQILDVASNMLSALGDDDFNFPALQTLICDNNRIKRLPNMDKLKSLASFTASDNQIDRFPDGFCLVDTLYNVDLSANQISVLDAQIANMENLTSLNISANPLRERKYLSMSTDILKTELAKRLSPFETTNESSDTKSVGKSEDSESHNTNGSKKKYTPEKGMLNLSSQNLKVIDLSVIDLDGPIHAVRLSNNDLTEFPLELLGHENVKHTLRSLDLSHTPSLHSTDYLTSDLALPVLQSLNIVSTGLTSLEALTTHLSAPELKELNISCHRMTGPVPFVRTSFPTLTTLLATDNWFTSIDAEAITGLEVVDISNNDIDHLPPKIGELGNLPGSKPVPGRLRAFECTGNRFRVPRTTVLEKGTEAILKDLRRMVPTDLVGDVWKE